MLRCPESCGESARSSGRTRRRRRLRAQNSSALVESSTHAMLSAQPAAAQQVQQHRLGVVVGGVRRGELVAGQRLQKGVAAFAGGFFDAFSVCGGVLGDVGAADGQGDAVPGAEGADEGLVAVGFRPAQAVVEVGGGDGDAQLGL